MLICSDDLLNIDYYVDIMDEQEQVKCLLDELSVDQSFADTSTIVYDAQGK